MYIFFCSGLIDAVSFPNKIHLLQIGRFLFKKRLSTFHFPNPHFPHIQS